MFVLDKIVQNISTIITIYSSKLNEFRPDIALTNLKWRFHDVMKLFFAVERVQFREVP